MVAIRLLCITSYDLVVRFPVITLLVIEHINLQIQLLISLIGPTNVSAFTFDDTNRAFVSIRLSVDGVRPLPMVDEEGNLIPTLATRVRVRDFPRDQGFLKMKFIIFKYVLENIDNQEKVAGRGDNIDKFAGQVSDMYVNLRKYHK